jgi:lysophospholipase L1-like esterase
MGVNTRKLLGLIGILVVLCSVFLFVSEVHASPIGDPVKIMPLGDSITVGYPGTDGYRKDLYWDLNYSGFNVDFVGSQQSGTGFDNDSEGHIGYYADQIRDDVKGWLDENPADIVLLHIGTNDIQSVQSVNGIVAEVSDTLNNIDQWESVHRPVTVILARIILTNNTTLNDKTEAYDDALQTMASTRIANGDHIIMVDMENALSYPADLVSDGIHPTAGGYGKMATVWYNALANLLGYSLTVNCVGPGSVTMLPEQAFYPYGTVVNLTATADNGWTFSTWSGDLNSSANPENITMDSNKMVNATFTQNTYSVSVSVLPSPAAGTVTPNGTGPYHYGDVVVLTESPGAGYSFSSWSGDGTGTGTNRIVTVTGNMAVTANYTQNEYSLSVTTVGSGSVSKSPDQVSYHYGDTVVLTAVPANGYSFSYWSATGSITFADASSTSTTATINGAGTITATFIQASPTPAPTPAPTAAPTPSPTPHPTASPSPSPSPTASPTPTPTVEPSVSPSQTPNGVNSSGNLYLIYGAVIIVVLVVAIVGVLVFVKFKHFSRNNSAGHDQVGLRITAH